MHFLYIVVIVAGVFKRQRVDDGSIAVRKLFIKKKISFCVFSDFN